ncbi:MAG: nitrilase-related carbon-nitrogen hydrolase [Anaerolineales bacterium]
MTQKSAPHTIVSDRWAYLWLGIAAVLMVFTFGMYRNPLAALLAPVFLIRFLRTRKVGTGYLQILLALVAANIISWWNFMPLIPTPGRIIIGSVFGFLYTIPFLLDRVLAGRFRGFAATLVFPFAYAAFEFLTMWPNPMGSMGSLAYGQFGSPHFIQLASITGLWGVTFLVSWFASTINWIWEEGAAWERIRRGTAVFAGAVLVVLAYGVIRLSYVLPRPGTVRIHGIVETDYTRTTFDTELWPLSETDPEAFRARMAPVYERYLQATVREADAGAQIVVWPEVAIEGYREDLDAVLARAQDIARRKGIYLAVGLNVLVPGPSPEGENRLVIIDPRGEVVINQRKYGCTAMNMYDYEIPTVDTPYGRLAGVLCCDLDFPYVVRQVSRKGVDILLVPSFEPTVEEIVAHSQMAPYRGIENGVSIFRLVSQGISQAFDPYGRTIGSMDATRANERVLVVQLPNHRVPTVYSLVGDLFGWLTVAGFVVMVVWAILRGRRQEA